MLNKAPTSAAGFCRPSVARLLARLLLASAFFASSLASSAGSEEENVGWLHYGNDLGNTRFQDFDQINPTNVSKLKPAWVFHTGVLDPQASLEVSPIVADGVMYVTTGHDDVFALDAASGKKLWAYHPLLLAPLSQLSVCCGRVNRGVAFGDGKVYLARLDGVLDAIDAHRGKVVWQRQVVNLRAHYSITMAPQFVDGLVIVGSSGGEFENRGIVTTFDAHTGMPVWRAFTTVPGPSWAGLAWQHGGGDVWETPAVDPDLGLVFVNTSNAAPDINGYRRAGDNLFTSSIVAFDLASGQFRWGFQEVHHDLWDYDTAQPPVLFTLEKDGRRLPALGECGKNGNYYILDRRTGKPLYPVEERRVPGLPEWQHASPTQPVSSVEPLTPLAIVPGTVDPKKLPPDIKLAPQYALPQEQKLLIEPGDDGGCEFPPAAFSPRTHFVYYGARYEPAVYHTFRLNDGPNAQGEFLGSTFHEAIPGVEDFGIYGAKDTTTGKVAWSIKVAQPAKSGVLVAGDLFFFGEGNGMFHAVDARTGKVLFTFDGTTIPRGGGAQAAPVAYIAAGREFVVNAFGGNFADRQFPPNPVGDTIVAFSLSQ